MTGMIATRPAVSKFGSLLSKSMGILGDLVTSDVLNGLKQESNLVIEFTLGTMANEGNQQAMSPNLDLTQQNFDFLVIGAGAAGLKLALNLADQGRVLVLAKGDGGLGATSMAQGGIATVLAETDSFEEHVQDTMQAGSGLCHEGIVQKVVRSGPKVIDQLIKLGAEFTPAAHGVGARGLHLTQEGGHSQRRVVHARDWTGAELMRVLFAAVESHPAIEFRKGQMVVDLVTTDKYRPDFSQNRCIGAYVLDQKNAQLYKVGARATFLCSGGHGKIYLYTTNPDSATGDGVALAWRAGCKIANLEFMQFHPTCLFHPDAKNFLISEAVRGEGGEIVNRHGEAFTYRHHPSGPMAPRDIVARAIDAELKESGETHVWLDAVRLGRERILEHFPYIYQRCLSYGIDMTKDPIPVVPAAHYSCGGVVVDPQGQTAVSNLYAVGEVACTGLHGANRLASNSLLEALVFADITSEAVRQRKREQTSFETLPDWDKGTAAPADELGILLTAWDEIRRLMWHYVGIVRSDARLKHAYDRIMQLRSEIDDYYWRYEVSERLLEVRNLVQVAYLTIRCAMTRKESRGIHFNINHPGRDDARWARDTITW